MPEIVYNVSKLLKYMSGNQGLSKKIIHYNKNNLNEDVVEVLSSSIDDSTSMGYVSRNLMLPNKKNIKIFEDKEGILVSRNGNAGILTYLPKGKYTMNDHAYILYLKEEFINHIDTYWLSLVLQKESLKFLSITEGNKTWNITKFMKEGRVIIPTKDDGTYDIEKQKEIAVKYKDIENKKNNLLKKIGYLSKVKIKINKEEKINYKSIKISDLCNPVNGNSDYTKEYCIKHKGNIPVYSGNTVGIFSYVNKADYNGKYLTWAKDGLAGYIMIHNGPFCITGHRGILIFNKDIKNIDLNYIKLILEPIFRASVKGRVGINGKNEYTTLNQTMIRSIKEEIKIPVDSKGVFDIDKQKEIAQKIAAIESIKQDLYNKVLSLVNIYIA